MKINNHSRKYVMPQFQRTCSEYLNDASCRSAQVTRPIRMNRSIHPLQISCVHTHRAIFYRKHPLFSLVYDYTSSLSFSHGGTKMNLEDNARSNRVWLVTRVRACQDLRARIHLLPL